MLKAIHSPCLSRVIVLAFVAPALRAADCNGNGVDDVEDVAHWTSPDCDGNFVPDECELASGASTDQDGNGVPDNCDATYSSQFIYGFEGCPGVVRGIAGEEVSFDLYATLTTRDNPYLYGAQGFDFSIEVDGGAVRAPSFEDMVVSAVLDDDGNEATPPTGPVDFELDRAQYCDVRNTWLEGVEGICGGAVLDFRNKVYLAPSGTARLVRFTVRAVIPEGEECKTLRVWYRDGLPFGQGVDNAVTFRAETVFPARAACTVFLCQQSFIRGDANADGRHDLSDAVYILRDLFVPPAPSTACPLAGDCNGDGAMDISDPIYFLMWLFMGGRKLPAPFPECGLPPARPTLPCPGGSTSCP